MDIKKMTQEKCFELTLLLCFVLQHNMNSKIKTFLHCKHGRSANKIMINWDIIHQ